MIFGSSKNMETGFDQKNKNINKARLKSLVKFLSLRSSCGRRAFVYS